MSRKSEPVNANDRYLQQTGSKIYTDSANALVEKLFTVLEEHNPPAELLADIDLERTPEAEVQNLYLRFGSEMKTMALSGILVSLLATDPDGVADREEVELRLNKLMANMDDLVHSAMQSLENPEEEDE